MAIGDCRADARFRVHARVRGSSSAIRAARLGLLLGGPLAWFLVVYFGVAVRAVPRQALWRVDVFTSEIVRQWGLQNFQTLWQNDVYRTITLRTVGLAAAVTVTDIVLCVPARVLRGATGDTSTAPHRSWWR